MVFSGGRLNPESLQQLSAEYIKENLVQQFLEEDVDGCNSNNTQKFKEQWKRKAYKLRQGITLPHSLWELLLRSHKRVGNDHISLLLVLADGPASYPVQRLSLRNATELTDDMLESLVINCPKELDIHNCPALTVKTFHVINKYGKNLETLVIGSSVQILPVALGNNSDFKDAVIQTTNSAWSALLEKIPKFFGSIQESLPVVNKVQYECLKTPNLKKLVIWGLHVKQKQSWVPFGLSFETEMDYWTKLTEEFISKLVFLDLSFCQEFVDFNFIVNAKHSLNHLILHDVLIPDDPFGWEILKQMSNLRLLDVSQSMELAAVYNQPDALLHGIVNSFTALSALDISGTNLAGHGTSEIAGLFSRVETPLEFLGLLGTHYNASKRLNIPAKRITGSGTQKQLMDSLNYYIERPGMLKKAFRMLYGKLIKETDFCYTQPCLNLTMEALEIHIDDKHVLLVGLCVLFNLMKRLKTSSNGSEFEELYYTSKFRKRIVSCVMKAIKAHSYDLTLLRNAFLVLCLLDITEDLAVVLHDIVDVLMLSIELALESSDLFLLRTSYFLLKPIVSMANVEDKKRLGTAGTIKKLCVIVDICVTKDILDHMPANWIILEYLTDDINENCQSFIESGGLDVFMKMKLKMPINVALAAALGVLANVASVPVNRQFFMRPEYIHAIFHMMNQSGNGEDIGGVENYRRLSYAAAACMAYLFEEPSWGYINPTKFEILKKLKELILSWDIKLNMGIELTSLEPILKIITASDIECRSFAVWTVANLTSLYPKKYVPMLGDLNYFLPMCKKAMCLENENIEYHSMLTNIIFENVKNYVTVENHF